MPHEDDVWKAIKDIAPYAAMGGAGGLIRALNTKPFSWQQACIKIITGAFGGGLSMAYLSTTSYSPMIQGAICGVVGIVGNDLVKALRIRLYKEVAGEYPAGNEDESDDHSDRIDDSPISDRSETHDKESKCANSCSDTGNQSGSTDSAASSPATEDTPGK